MSSYVPRKLRGVLDVGGDSSTSSSSSATSSSSLRSKNGRKTRPWRVDAASWKQQLHERKAVYDHFALPESHHEEHVEEKQEQQQQQQHRGQQQRYQHTALPEPSSSPSTPPLDEQSKVGGHSGRDNDSCNNNNNNNSYVDDDMIAKRGNYIRGEVVEVGLTPADVRQQQSLSPNKPPVGSTNRLISSTEVTTQGQDFDPIIVPSSSNSSSGSGRSRREKYDIRKHIDDPISSSQAFHKVDMYSTPTKNETSPRNKSNNNNDITTTDFSSRSYSPNVAIHRRPNGPDYDRSPDDKPKIDRSPPRYQQQQQHHQMEMETPRTLTPRAELPTTMTPPSQDSSSGGIVHLSARPNPPVVASSATLVQSSTNNNTYTNTSFEFDIDDYDDDGIMASRTTEDDDDNDVEDDDDGQFQPSSCDNSKNDALQRQRLQEHDENEDNDEYGNLDGVSLGPTRLDPTTDYPLSPASSVASTHAIYGGNKYRVDHQSTDNAIYRDADVVSNNVSTNVTNTSSSTTVPPLTTSPSFEGILNRHCDLFQKTFEMNERRSNDAEVRSSMASTTSATTDGSMNVQLTPSDNTSNGQPEEKGEQYGFSSSVPLSSSLHRPVLSIVTDLPRGGHDGYTMDDVEDYDNSYNYDNTYDNITNENNDGDDQSHRLDTPHPVVTHELSFSRTPDLTRTVKKDRGEQHSNDRYDDPSTVSIVADPDPLQRARKNLLLSDLSRTISSRRIIGDQDEDAEKEDVGVHDERRQMNNISHHDNDDVENTAMSATEAVVAEMPITEASNDASSSRQQQLPVSAAEGQEESQPDMGTADDHDDSTKDTDIVDADDIDTPVGKKDEIANDKTARVEIIQIVSEAANDKTRSTIVGRDRTLPDSPAKLLLAELTNRLQTMYTGNHHCVESSGQAVIEQPVALRPREGPSPEQRESREFVIEELNAIVSTLPIGHHHVVESHTPPPDLRKTFKEDGLGYENGEGIVLARDDCNDDDDKVKKSNMKKRESLKVKKWKDRLASKKSTRRDSAGPELADTATSVTSIHPVIAEGEDTPNRSISTTGEIETMETTPSRPPGSIMDSPLKGGVQSMNADEKDVPSTCASLSDANGPRNEELILSPSSHSSSKSGIMSPTRPGLGNSKTIKWKQRLAKRRGSEFQVPTKNEPPTYNTLLENGMELTGTIVTIQSSDFDDEPETHHDDVLDVMHGSQLSSSSLPTGTEDMVEEVDGTNYDIPPHESNPVQQSSITPITKNTTPFGFDNLQQSFSAFDKLLKERPGLPLDDEVSLWTEVTEVTMGQNGNNVPVTMPRVESEVIHDEEQSYMDFTIEESVQPSFVDYTIASASVADPKRSGQGEQLMSPFMSTLLSSRMFQDVDTTMLTQQQQFPHQHQLEQNSRKFPTIMVQSEADDDMTQITFDHTFEDDDNCDKQVHVDQSKNGETKKYGDEEFFDAVSKSISVPSGAKSQNSVKSRTSLKSRKSTKSQRSDKSNSSNHSSESSNQRIAEILRKDIWRRDLSVVQAAVEELDKLASNGSRYRAHIVRCGGVMAIMRTMETHADHEMVLVPCCRTLEKLALGPETQAAICEMEGIPLIVRTMQEHADSAAVQEAACATLATICRRQEADNVKDPMKEADGAVFTLLTSMTRYATNGRIQSQAFAAISNLCMDSRERLAELSEAGGIMTLTMSLQRPWENKNEQHEAISHLSILLRGIAELNETATPHEIKSVRMENNFSDHTTSEELDELPKYTETKLEGTSRTSEDSSSLSTEPEDIGKGNAKGHDRMIGAGSNELDGEGSDDSSQAGPGITCEGKRGMVQVVSEHSSNEIQASSSMEDIPEILTIPSNDDGSLTKRAGGDDEQLGPTEGKTGDEKCRIQ